MKSHSKPDGGKRKRAQPGTSDDRQTKRRREENGSNAGTDDDEALDAPLALNHFAEEDMGVVNSEKDAWTSDGWSDV